jgi:hypothetical protein
MSEMPTTRAREPVVMVHGYAVDVAALTPAQNELLEKIANRIRLRLAKQPNIWVEIDVEGHTDSTHTETYNKDLGLRRATGVANQLQSLFSARFRDRVYLDTRSAGDTEPIASNKTEKTRSRNRRVELRLEWVAPPAQPSPSVPEKRRPHQPPRVKVPPPDTRPCFEYRKLEQQFRGYWEKLEKIYFNSRVVWIDGSKLTLQLTNRRLLRQELNNVATQEITSAIAGPVQDAASGEIFGEVGANVIALALSELEFLSTLTRDIDNERIMKDDDERQLAHRRLVAAAVAAHTVRGGPAEKASFYIWLYKTWDTIGRLQYDCDKSRGRVRQQSAWPARVP